MMKVEKIIKHDEHNKIAYCDNGLGFFIRPGFKIKEGDIINTDVHFIEAEVGKLKREIKDLTTSDGKASKYKKWILEVFEDHDQVAVWKLQAAAKEKGYSWQMIQKVRKSELDELIMPVHIKKKGGWHWKDVRGKL